MNQQTKRRREEEKTKHRRNKQMDKGINNISEKRRVRMRRDEGSRNGEKTENKTHIIEETLIIP